MKLSPALVIFWLSAAFVLYTYGGYPLCLLVLRRLRQLSRDDVADASPFLSIILAVRNEERHIGHKLAHLLALDYPPERFEVLVVSDGSTDHTNATVHDFTDPRVQLIECPEPVGKAAAINRTVPLARGEVLVPVDVRQTLAPETLRVLARHFADPRVGLVGAEMVIVDEDGRPTAEGNGLYWRYERWIRGLEAAAGLLNGVCGPCYAVRREVFQPIPPGSYCDDVAVALHARMAGWEIRSEPRAEIYEQLRDQKIEFSRKVRTLVGNYQLLCQFWPLYLPWRGGVAFSLLSHKLCRLAIPLVLLALLGSSALLSPQSPVYMAALAGQLGIYAFGLLGITSERCRRRMRLANVCGTFCILNTAALLALIHVLRHGPRIGWR